MEGWRRQFISEMARNFRRDMKMAIVAANIDRAQAKLATLSS